MKSFIYHTLRLIIELMILSGLHLFISNASITSWSWPRLGGIILLFLGLDFFIDIKEWRRSNKD